MAKITKHKNLSRLAQVIFADKKVPIFQPPHAGEDPGQRAGFFCPPRVEGVLTDKVRNLRVESCVGGQSSNREAVRNNPRGFFCFLWGGGGRDWKCWWRPLVAYKYVVPVHSRR